MITIFLKEKGECANYFLKAQFCRDGRNETEKYAHNVGGGRSKTVWNRSRSRTTGYSARSK